MANSSNLYDCSSADVVEAYDDDDDEFLNSITELLNRGNVLLRNVSEELNETSQILNDMNPPVERRGNSAQPPITDLTNMTFDSSCNIIELIDDDESPAPPPPPTRLSSLATTNDDIIVLESESPARYLSLPDGIIDLCTPTNIEVSRPPVLPPPCNFARMASLKRTLPILDEPEVSASKSSKTSPGGMQITCPVCLEDVINRRPHTIGCGHIFCEECMNKVMKVDNKCPICRKRIQKNKVIRLFLGNEN